MAPRNAARYLSALLIFVMLASCGSGRVKDGPPGRGSRPIALPGDAVPRPELRSRYGNGPDYEVFGKRYTVMASSSGYKERGVASWYGKKFHGNLTANREPYDMYAMSAAHKTLPLPTYVRVRNLRNNRSVIVRVNDRGPFVNNRIIDLSYVAALKLDMVRDGTSFVEIEAISFDEPSGDRPTRQVSIRQPDSPTPAAESAAGIYVQVGAFGDRSNAERRLMLLSSIGSAFIVEDAAATNRALYRVRLGPIDGIVQYDVVVKKLADLGITDPYLVTQ